MEWFSCHNQGYRKQFRYCLSMGFVWRCLYRIVADLDLNIEERSHLVVAIWVFTSKLEGWVNRIQVGFEGFKVVFSSCPHHENFGNFYTVIFFFSVYISSFLVFVFVNNLWILVPYLYSRYGARPCPRSLLILSISVICCYTVKFLISAAHLRSFEDISVAYFRRRIIWGNFTSCITR